MARHTVIIGVFCAWMSLLTLLPAYLLLSGRYSLVKQSDFRHTARNLEKAAGGGPLMDDGHLQQPVRRVRTVEDSDIGQSLKRTHRDTESSELAALGLYPAADSIESSVISADIKKALHNGDHSKSSRSAFELVIALSSLLPKISNISRMKTPSPEAFRKFVAPMGLPVIFTDMLKSQMLGEWSWEYVRSKWGETVFHNTRQGNYSTKTSKAGKHLVNRVSVKLADFIDVVTGKRKANKNERGMYITKQKVIPDKALEAEFYYPPFYPGAHKKCFLEPTGWIGAPGTFTQGHIDSKDNFVYQIIGRKKWRIFSPQDYKYLYYTQTKGSLEWSEVLATFSDVDRKKYPLYAKTTPITFTMEPGEVLYLPRGWTHMVENVSPALMINVWRYGPAAITEHWSDKNKQEIYKRCMS